MTLRIADQGGGIPDDQLDKVFQYGFTTVGAQDSTVPVSAGPLRRGTPLVNRLASFLLLARHQELSVWHTLLREYRCGLFLNLKNCAGSLCTCE